MSKKVLCHVCGKEKKPYVVILTSNIFSLIHYEEAREDGEICERCDQYFAMTGEFKDATEKEFKIAQESCKFARDMLKWWTKDGKMNPDEPAMRDWEGTSNLAKWYRKEKLDAQAHKSEPTEDKR